MASSARGIGSLLVLGGARSGKSRFAQTTAEASGHALCYIATAEAADAEMALRIGRHQADRGRRWTTIEEPLALAETLLREAAPQRLVLVDCVSFWLANLLFAGRDETLAGEALAASIPNLPGPVIFVANEVGYGIVPDNALGRRFRDAQGWLNQRLAAACERVVLVAAGLPVQLKPAAAPELRF